MVGCDMIVQTVIRIRQAEGVHPTGRLCVSMLQLLSFSSRIKTFGSRGRRCRQAQSSPCLRCRSAGRNVRRTKPRRCSTSCEIPRASRVGKARLSTHAPRTSEGFQSGVVLMVSVLARATIQLVKDPIPHSFRVVSRDLVHTWVTFQACVLEARGNSVRP